MIPGEYGLPPWQGLHNSFSKESIVHFWSSIFETISLGNIFYCSYDGITGHFLDPKWWIVLSCICLFKKCMSKTSMHPCRKWIVQSNNTSNFTCFFPFSRLLIGSEFFWRENEGHLSSPWNANRDKYVVSPNHSLKFKFFMDLTNVETLINLDQPILDNFGREKNHSLCWRWIAGWFFGLNFWH